MQERESVCVCVCDNSCQLHRKISSAPGSSSSSSVSPVTSGVGGRVLGERVSPLSNSSSDARYRQGRRAAENVERALLTDIAPLLPGFVAACDMAQMLYMTPLLVTTLGHYPEDLSIQLQLVEAMHRIIHLPLSCWTDALTVDHEQGESEYMYENREESTGASPVTQDASHHPVLTPEKSDPRGSRASQHDGGGESPGSRDKKRAIGLLIMSRDLPRKYASCCTPLRGQRRYSYFRPHLMPAGEAAAVLLQQLQAPALSHSTTATSESFEPANARTFEKVCATFVDGLLRIVEMQNTEIALFRAVLVCTSL